MRIKSGLCAFALIGVLTLSGCDSSEYPKAKGGAAIGAVLGGLAAAALEDDPKKRNGAILKGVLVGTLVGGGIGLYLDAEDMRRREAAARAALISGQKQRWRNPSNGTGGTVTPVSTKSPLLSDDCDKIRFESFKDDQRIEYNEYDACVRPDGTIYFP